MEITMSSVGLSLRLALWVLHPAPRFCCSNRNQGFSSSSWLESTIDRQIESLAVGPTMFTDQAEFAYAIFWSMLFVNLLFLLVGLYGARAFARVTLIPVTVLWPCVFVFSIVGAYALDQSMFDVWIAIAAGILGYFMRMYGFSVVPLAIGLILGGMLEQRLGQSMVMLDEKWWLMLSRPISLFFFILTALALFGRPVFQLINRTKATDRGV